MLAWVQDKGLTTRLRVGQVKPPKLFLLLLLLLLTASTLLLSAVGNDNVFFTIPLARAIQPEGFAAQVGESTGRCVGGHLQHDWVTGRK